MKINKQTLGYFLLIFLVFTESLSLALPGGRKHPRVIEVEKVLTRDASLILNDVIRNKPFAIFIEIDPIHRNAEGASKDASLPFYEPDEEIKDEWDDPLKTDYALLQRVNRVNIKILVPPELTDEQIDELKQGLMTSLHLITGRDTIEIQKKTWMAEKDPTAYSKWLIQIGFVIVCMLGLMFLVVAIFSLNRVVNAIKNIKISAPEGGSAGGGAAGGGFANVPMGSPPASSALGREGRALEGMKDLRLNDPIKMMEILKSFISTLEHNKTFPHLSDMIILDKYCKEDPRALGALLAEFPEDLRTNVFSLSYNPEWLDAFSNPGEITPRTLDITNRLIKNLRPDDKTHWQNFLILCWRLDTELTGFLKSMPWDHAMAILVDLPRSLALPIAREVVPGNWGVILKPDFRPNPIQKEKLEIYRAKAISLRPLRTFKKIEDYKREVDLLEFLRTVPPDMEKEIYGASAEDSLIRQSRPPFYKVIEAGADELQSIINLVSIEEWALSLFNLSKKQRTTIEEQLSERQRFRLIEYFRAFDRTSPDPSLVGDARDKVAKLFKDFNEVIPMFEQLKEANSETKKAG